MTVSSDERVEQLRSVLEQIAAGPCTGRPAGCKWSRSSPCPKHLAEAALASDDWDAP